MAGLSELFYNEDCNEFFEWELCTFIGEAVMTSIIFTLSLRSLYEMHSNNKLKEMSFLYFTQILFYLSSILCSALYLLNHCAYCFTSSSSWLYNFSWTVAILSYVVHWGALLLALFFKLHYIFLTTAYEISALFAYAFFGLFASAGLIALICAVYFDYVAQHRIYALLSGELLLAAVVLFHAALSLQFVYKLYAVSQAHGRVSVDFGDRNPMRGAAGMSSAESEDEDEVVENVENEDIASDGSAEGAESRIVILIRKYTILSLVTSVGAIALWVAFSVCMYRDIVEHFFDNVLMVFYLCNVLVDVVCMALSHPFYGAQYAKWCGAVDGGCRRCCEGLSEHKIKRKIRKTQMVLQNSEAEFSPSDDEDEEEDGDEQKPINL